MKHIKKNAIFVLGLFLGMLISTTVIYNQPSHPSDLPINPFRSAVPSDPSTPENLSLDVFTKDYYTVVNHTYYYRTATPAASRYHVVWAIRADLSFSIDLSLYNDSGYSNLLAKSVSGPNSLEWVIYRPSAPEILYPEVYVLGLDDYYYVEWEDSSETLQLDVVTTGGLNSALGDPENCVEVYEISLDSSKRYDLSLQYSSATTKLYLYYLQPGAATNWSSYLAVGHEISAFSPPSSGNYALLVVSKYWDMYNLIFEISQSLIPGFELIPVLLGFCLGILLLIKRRSMQPKDDCYAM